MNLADAIYTMLKGAQYRGNVDGSTQEQYDKIEWCDERPKPKWEEVAAVMAKNEMDKSLEDYKAELTAGKTLDALTKLIDERIAAAKEK